MRELFGASCRRLFIAAGAAAIALALPFGWFGVAVLTSAPTQNVFPIGLAGRSVHPAGVDDTNPPGLIPPDLAQRLENLTGGDSPVGTTPTGLLPDDLLARLENLNATVDEPASGTSLSDIIAASAQTDDDRPFTRVATTGAGLRSSALGRYVVLGAGVLLWAAMRCREGRSARAQTIAGTALVGYAALRLVTFGFTTTLFVLVVSTALALSTIIGSSARSERAAQPA